MLTRKPYSRLPLHVRIFTENTWQMWNECGPVDERDTGTVAGETESAGQNKKKKKTGKDKGREKQVRGVKRFGPFKSLPETIDVTFDRGGVDGKALTGPVNAEGTPGRPVPIDVGDTAFRTAHWQKWQRVSDKGAHVELGCGICHEPVDAKVCSGAAPTMVKLTRIPQNHLTFAVCPSDPSAHECHATFHLPCLAGHFLPSDPDTSSPAPVPRPLLPKTGTCPSCSTPLEWGQVIRGCYTRRDGERDAVVDTEKEASRAAKKLAVEERRRAKALEKAAGKGTGRKRATAASQVNTEIEEDDEETGSDLGSGARSQDGDDDPDADLMRSMLRDGEGSADGSESQDDEPMPPPPKTRKAPAKTRATAKRGRGAAAGKPATTRAPRKNKASVAEPQVELQVQVKAKGRG